IGLLWPSIAGRMLLFAFVPVLAGIVWAVKRSTPAGAPGPNPGLVSLQQIVVGMVIGLCLICATEVYGTVCHAWMGGDIGDREPGRFCAGEEWLLQALMLARQSKDWVGDYGLPIITVVVVVVSWGAKALSGPHPHRLIGILAGPVVDFL